MEVFAIVRAKSRVGNGELSIPTTNDLQVIANGNLINESIQSYCKALLFLTRQLAVAVFAAARGSSRVLVEALQRECGDSRVKPLGNELWAPHSACRWSGVLQVQASCPTERSKCLR
jgi:hypothetical protein